MMRKTPKVALRKETVRMLMSSDLTLGRVVGGGDTTGAKECPAEALLGDGTNNLKCVRP